MTYNARLSLLVLVAAGLVANGLPAFAQVFQELYSFSGAADGGGPQGALIQGRDGNLYGTTGCGGKWTVGTVFKVTPKGLLTTVASFDGTNGNYPYGALLEASDGNFYGATAYGGAGWNNGVIFKVTPMGELTRLWSFFTQGVSPVGDLAQGTDGFLYGACEDGGDYNSHGTIGTIFRISTNGWDLVNLHLFYGDDGLYPSGGLLLAHDGNFYGVTAGGGLCTGDGTIYRLTTNGTVMTVASFCQGPGNPASPLLTNSRQSEPIRTIRPPPCAPTALGACRAIRSDPYVVSCMSGISGSKFAITVQ